MAKKNIGLSTSIQVLQSRIAELEAELKHQDWVSVRDGLPENMDDVLVALNVNGTQAVRRAWYAKLEGWCLRTEIDYTAFITHWRKITLPKQ